MVIVTGPEPLSCGDAESVTATVTFVMPVAVGVPVMEQFAFSVSPAGMVPLARWHVYGEVPPLTPTLPLYGVSSVPAGGEEIVNVVVAALMVIVTAPVVELAGFDESVAFTVMFEVPVAVGVPVMEQLAFSVSPAGMVPPTNAQV
jgi:hypothetical protein